MSGESADTTKGGTAKAVIDSFSGQYRFLSNFYPAQVEYDGLLFPSVEHAYQAAKGVRSPSQWTEEARRTWMRQTPSGAKRAGRFLPLRTDWETVKIEIMRELLRHKFSYPLFRQQLLDTGTAELIEGNHWGDRFWGQVNGVGENWLGKLLMEIREDLSI